MIEKMKESINKLDLTGHHFISPSNESNSAGDILKYLAYLGIF